MNKTRITTLAVAQDHCVNWDPFVHACPSGTFFHTSAWLRALSEGMGHDIRIHFLEDCGTIVAGAVVRRSSKLGFTVGRKPWSTAYNGIVTRSGDDDDSAHSLRAHLSQTYHHVRLVQPPGADASAESHWTATKQVTPIIAIDDLDKTWASFDRRVRQRVRKATKAGVTVREEEHPGSFYDLYRMTYNRQGLPMPLSTEEVVRTLLIAKKHGPVRFFLARTREGEPAAALVTGADTRRAYFILAGSHPEHRKTDAMTLLWWDVIQRYAKTHNEIDLVGVGTPGMAKFKKAFAPTLLGVQDVSCFSSWLARSSLHIVSRARKVVAHFRGKDRGQG